MTTTEPVQQVDLTNCDREPIHLLGTIQNHGYFLALSADWMVCFASANISELLGSTAEDMVGCRLSDFVSEAAFQELGAALQYAYSQQRVQQVSALELSRGQGPFDAAIHVSGRYIVIEFEKAAKNYSELKSPDTVRSAITQLQAIGNVGQLMEQGVRYLQMLTGFDRVMAYRFTEDGSGEVVAEALSSKSVEPFLGLRYPASDIPQQARRLYKQNPIRYIADVASPPIPLVPSQGPQGEIIDLSQSTLRSVSPIHIEYLRNMGVATSMSISILCGGRLWGLFACHHLTPKYIGNVLRNACDLFGQMFSLTLENKERNAALRDEDRVSQLHTRILSAIANYGSEQEQLQRLAPEFRQLIACDGLAIYLNGIVILEGRTPSEEEMNGLIRFLNQSNAASIFSTDRLSEIYPKGADFVDRAAGLIAIPISRTPRDYLIFFRQEIIRSVQWAGHPEKPVEVGTHGIRLTPRKSFEAYQQIVSGRSENWTDSELRLANALRTTLLEVVLKLNDAVVEERKQAVEKQELLISELNHRVRNLLGLVRGLIGRTKATAQTAEDYVEMLDQRIHALARAHDQITEHNWSPGSVRKLIEAEGKAYLLENAGRLRMSGVDVLLEPAAISTLALVIHELVTNSAKYGALCDQSGHVEIKILTGELGELILHWREIGGPPVKPPSRRGFGSTIIERSIPFELKGEAQLDYKLTGLEARFMIPSRYVAATSGAQIATQEERGGGSEPLSRENQVSVLERVLVVEDNIVIALDMEAMLQGMGAEHVEVASSVADGLAAIEKKAPTFALLDVNLGPETSFALADALRERSVPYGFASGYGEQSAVPEEHRDAPMLTKPVDEKALLALVAALAKPSEA